MLQKTGQDYGRRQEKVTSHHYEVKVETGSSICEKRQKLNHSRLLGKNWIEREGS